MEIKTIEEELELMINFVKVFNPENKPYSVTIGYDNFGSGYLRKNYYLYIADIGNTQNQPTIADVFCKFVDSYREIKAQKIEEEGKEVGDEL